MTQAGLRSVFRSLVSDFCTVMSKFRSNELVFFLSVSTETEKRIRSSVYFVMVKIPVFTTAHVSELICHCRTAFFSFVQPQHYQSFRNKHGARIQSFSPPFFSFVWLIVKMNCNWQTYIYFTVLFCCLFPYMSFWCFYYIIYMCIAVQIQYSAAYKVEFLWQFTINMQHEDRKFIQHKIQYTGPQCGVGVGVSRELVEHSMMAVPAELFCTREKIYTSSATYQYFYKCSRTSALNSILMITSCF